MAETGNFSDLQKQAYALIDTLNRLVTEGNATIFDIADIQKKLENILKDFPLSEIQELRSALKDNNKIVIDSIDEAAKASKERIRVEQEHNAKVQELTEKLDAYNGLLDDANEDQKKYIEDKISETKKELKETKEQHQAELDGRKVRWEAEKALDEEKAREQKVTEEKVKESRKKIVNLVESTFSKVIGVIENQFTRAIDSVVSSYEQHSGKLSAVLNSTTEDIGNLQRKIASELRDTSLSSAISNIAVMSEVASMANMGFTNTETIQSNATAYAEARKIAPNLNIDSTTVKNLTNVFGSDFITRFASIQTAVQETAGSTAFLSQNLSKMMDDLEPVYLNAEYQYNATQATADVQATLSSAIESGIINESQAQEYMSMITELMDPSKAFKSNSTAVRVAATNYDFGSGDPMQALQAILNARGQMYSGIDMSSSYGGNLSRSLAASAFGDNTMNATYMQSGLYGLNTLTTDNLESVWTNQLGKLQSGDFTTKREEEKNWFESSSFTQSLSKISEYAPLTYSLLGGILLGTINSLPRRIASAINNKIDGEGFSSRFGGRGTTAESGSLVGSKLNVKQGSTLSNIINSNFATKSLFGLGKAGSRVGMLTSGATLGMVGAGAIGAINLANQWDNDRTFAQNASFGGNYGSSILSNASMGAGVGAIVGSLLPGVGNIIGGAVGGVAGAIYGLTTAIVANKQIQEENTKAIQAQTQSTKDLLGEGVTAVDALEAKREIARGGGIAHLSSGDYAIDYQKSKYAGFAGGLDYVPYDEFPARLHKGEAVVTADAARRLRDKDPNFWNTPMNDDNNIVGALREQTESIVNAVNGEKQYSPLTKVGPKQYVIRNQFT